MDLHVGDQITSKFGPYRAYGTVTEIKPQGAVVRWGTTAIFEGHDAVAVAPNGTQLTTDKSDGFIGRAHWAATGRVEG